MKMIPMIALLPAIALSASCAAGPAPVPAAEAPAPSAPAAPSPGTPLSLPSAAPGTVVDFDPAQAYAFLKSDPAAVLLDVRTQAEYIFVGHPVGALNIPMEFWDEKTYQWSGNPSFDAKVQAKVPKDRPVVVICRSGNRSRTAGERLLKLGYARVYNVTESFEGDADPATKLRTVNGWKNRGLPWTYAVDPKLLYWP